MSYGLASYGAESYGLGEDEGAGPLIYGWIPSAGLQISRLDWVGFTVTSKRPLVSVVARVIYRSGITETIYDSNSGGHFSGLYWRGSASIVIAAGIRIVCRRSGGWPAATFRLHVRAVDDRGRAAIGQGDYA